MEEAVLDRACSLLVDRGGVLCVEARSLDDASAAKATPNHYRRFIEPAAFERKLVERGLTVSYMVEGRGFAKYLEDDAVAFRIIARS